MKTFHVKLLLTVIVLSLSHRALSSSAEDDTGRANEELSLVPSELGHYLNAHRNEGLWIFEKSLGEDEILDVSEFDSLVPDVHSMGFPDREKRRATIFLLDIKNLSGVKEYIKVVGKEAIALPDPNGNTLLHKTLSVNAPYEVIDLILATNSTAIIAPNQIGQFPLHIALSCCDEETTKLLLANKADPNSVSTIPDTPLRCSALQLAFMRKDSVPVCARALLDSGATFERPTFGPFKAAVSSCRSSYVEAILKKMAQNNLSDQDRRLLTDAIATSETFRKNLNQTKEAALTRNEISTIITLLQRRLKDQDSFACAATDCQNNGIKLCGGCEQIPYCSESCQKADWKGHKNRCVKINVS